MWADHRINTAGGLTRREFLARYKNWDPIREFTIWQVSWLWVDLEPQTSTEPTEGTPAYPTFRWIKENLDSGKIPGAEKINDRWLWTNLSRQQLIDFALEVNARPKFLFPEERRSWPLPSIAKWIRNEVPHNEVSSYQSLYTFLVELQVNLENFGYRNQDLLSSNIYPVIRNWLKNGQYQAIGRNKKNGYKYYYIHIPSWHWEDMEILWDRCVFGKHEYVDVMVKQISSQVSSNGA